MGDTQKPTTSDRRGRFATSRVGKRDGCEPRLAIDITGVYCKYYHRVVAWCCRIVRNPEDAEDLAQDAFVHVIRKIHTFRGEANFSTWLYRVVMNTIFMRLRKKRLPQSSLDEFLASWEGALWHQQASHMSRSAWPDPDARIDLDRAIHQLPTGFKMALVLHDVEEYHHSEIAKLRGWTVGTSKSQLHRARQRVRDLLGDQRADCV